MKKFFYFLILLSLVFFLSSCNKSDDSADLIVFDSQNPYAIYPDVEWALVTEPYVGFHEENNRASATNSYCREGEILQVKGFSYNEDKEQWYLFDSGWIISSSLKIYKNRYKAESAAKIEAAKASKGRV